MGLEGLDFQRIEIPFAAGLDTKKDPRAMQPPGLDICTDAQFDSIAALETRKPFVAIGTNILGGGTLSNVRRVFEGVDGELLCFTIDTLYSWDSRDSAWVARGTHLAAAVAEKTQFATTDDQIDCDRAELGGTAVYAWTGGSGIYAAAIDKTTGAPIVGPTLVGGVTGGTRPRLVACQTKILLFGNFSNLSAIAIDPANVATSLAGSWTTVVATAVYYDVTQVIGADQVVGATHNATTTAYTAFTCTAGMTIATVTKSRTCDGPIAVSCTPDAAHVQIIRGNGTAVQGDLLTLTALADVFTAQALGTAAATPINQIAAVHLTAQVSGQYRCQVFWDANETANTAQAFWVQGNWVDTGNSLGTSAQLVAWVGLASRAFTYNGRCYVWTAFGQTSGLGSGSADTSASGNFQNAYFLYRDDGFLVAKAVYDAGGGLSPSTGRLPHVALTSGSTIFSVALNVRRIISVGAGQSSGAQAPTPSNYAMRSPQDVTLTFDSNDARRVVRLGRTLYIGCGEGCLQYDGQQLTEVNFHVAPWYFDAVITGTGSGLLVNGLYAYKSTFGNYNARGEHERSTSECVANATMTTGSTAGFAVQPVALAITHKGNAPSIEIWRTTLNPTASAPFYLITSLNPNSVTNPNRYLPNTILGGLPVTVNDYESDAVASVNEDNPGNDGELESMSAPAATIITTTVDRVFLGNVAGAPDTVWYSKQRNDGEIVAFNDANTFDVPPAGGTMTGLVYHQLAQVLIAFRQRAVYAFPGTGFDNGAGGSNYGPAQTLSTDVGAVNPDAIAVGPFGAMFQTSKGWYKLDGGLNLQYIGEKVAAFDGDTVLAVHVMDAQHQVRVVTNNRILVYDYYVGEWAQWSIATGLHATMWKGQYVYLDSAQGPMLEQTSFTAGVTYGLDVETAWFTPGGLQGRLVVLAFQLLGEFRSACDVRVRVARDYQQDGAGNWLYFDDVTWPVTPSVVGGPLQVRHGPSQKRCQAMKVRITVVGTAGGSPNGEACRLTGLAFLVAQEPGLYSGLPVAQKA